MNSYVSCIIAAITGYLIGNVQFAVILSRLFHHDDVRNHGSGNAGSTNMLRVYGVKSGVLTFIGDFLKGVLGVIIGRAIGGEYAAYCAGMGVILGHDFPAFFRFRGGKGVAASFGIICVLTPMWTLGVALIAVIVIALTRTISLVSITSAVAYLAIALIFGEDLAIKIFAVLAASLLLIRHKDNIKRLIQGQEDSIRAGNKDSKTKNS